MSTTGSVTHWLQELKTGAHAAAQPLWERYYCRLIGLARKRLQHTPRRAADEEDVVLSAFGSFCRGAEQGRFPRLEDRQDLWQVLVLVTARKACSLIRRERCPKRGGGAVLDEAALSPDADAAGLDQVIGDEPTPAFAAEVADQFRWLLERLGRPDLQEIALRKLEGYSHEEIAEQLGCAVRTIERKLRRIRSIWEREAGHE